LLNKLITHILIMT